jgi:plastocyanin
MRFRNFIIVVFLGCVLTTGALLIARADESVVTASKIVITNFTFDPKTITVPVGTKVTWTNKDDTIHRVMITDLKAKSDALDTDQSFSYIFDKSGTYGYFCTMHPMMTGTVVVTEK